MVDFEKVYSEYYDTVFYYILSLCQNQSMAEDITQETFFKAIKKIDSFKGECKLSVWLCQIAKNTMYSEIKKRKKEIPDVSLDTIPYYDSAYQNLLIKENAKEIHRILHNLKEPYKEVFWMRTFGNLSFREIASLFGKSESWARVTYHRARMKIKEEVR